MALSYQSHPLAYIKLHHLMADPAHPAWSAAISRLGDIGDGFSVKQLRPMIAKLDPEQQRLARDSLERIFARTAEISRLMRADSEAANELVEREMQPTSGPRGMG